MRAVVYCRVSSKEQVDNFSLPTQEAGCRAYCERQGWTIDRVFIERGESAKTADRPEFKRMLDHCRQQKGRIFYVIVYNLSRFARNQYDHHAIRALLGQFGIELRSVTEPIDESMHGKLLQGVLAAVHEAENDLRRDRSVTGMRAAVKAGKWCWHPPKGYVNHQGALVPDPKTAPLILKAFELVASGHNASEARTIVAAMGLKVARSDFFKLLRRSIYCGWIEAPSWGLRARGTHPAIVPQETWDRAQVALNYSGGNLHLWDHPDFPLRRFVECGRCGRPYTAGWSKGRSRLYGYYRCVNSGCKAGNVPKADIEGDFADLLRSLQPSEECFRLFREICLDRLNREAARSRSVRRGLREDLDAVEDKRGRLVEAYIYDHAIGRDIYEAQLDKLNQELALARLRLSEADVKEINAEGILGFAEQLIRNASQLWARLGADGKRRFQRFVFPSGVKYADRRFLNPQPSPVFLLLDEIQHPQRGIGRGERI